MLGDLDNECTSSETNPRVGHYLLALSLADFFQHSVNVCTNGPNRSREIKF